ncbi:hypothetical protein J4209_06855 [Candidatus Woesearchaeota archaeon]|nr:hypothetical protein [Candidatus Woesearchaeota archaeon]
MFRELSLEKLVLPAEIAQRLRKRSIHINEETTGHLICLRVANTYVATAIVETGRESLATVGAGKSPLVAFLNKWIDSEARLTDIGDYAVIDYHIHTEKTISTYGEYFAKNFSGGDLGQIRERAKEFYDYIKNYSHHPLSFSEYVHLLITPKVFHAVKLGAGQSDPINLPVVCKQLNSFNKLETETIEIITPFLGKQYTLIKE